MKKAVLVLTLVLGGLVSNAQLNVEKPIERGTIGEIRNAVLSYTLRSGNDTTFILTFKNEKYQYISDYKSFGYYSGNKSGNVNHQLYELLLSVFDKDEKFRQQITLGDDEIIISKINETKIWLYSSKGYFSLTKNDLQKLFNK